MTTPEKDKQFIRVHTVDEAGEGRVYARLMEPLLLPGQETPMYAVRGQVPVPEGLTQQEVVYLFRADGWVVEQDLGTDFDNPVWGP